MVTKKPTAKRGRPKSAQTLEREKTDAWLKNPPAHLPLLTKGEKQILEQSFEASEKIRQSLLAGHSPLIPNELIYAIESIGDEAMEGYEGATLEQYAVYQAKEREAKRTGGQELAIQADKRAANVWGKNPELAKRIAAKKISLNGAAKIILEHWESKGDKFEKPSIKTIANWYKRIRPN